MHKMEEIILTAMMTKALAGLTDAQLDDRKARMAAYLEMIDKTMSAQNIFYLDGPAHCAEIYRRRFTKRTVNN